ncbi:MAG: hypothetical protein GY711_29040 [bacterium]|nr:hypothetical protein [bacterium]
MRRTTPSRSWEQLGQAAYVDRYVLADATHYRPDGPRPHVVVLEMMQRALVKEPQVAATRNLVRWMRPGGLLVPQSIAVDAAVDAVIDAGRHVARLIDLNVESAREPLEPVRVTLPGGVHVVELRTEIVVSDGIGLGRGDSGLTLPLVLPRPAGGPVEFSYRMGKRPGFEMSVWSSE